MKLAFLTGVTLLVFMTLATSFPLVVAAQNRVEERSANVEDHMVFTRQIAEQGIKLEVLNQQYQGLIQLPERMARVEERIDNLVRMVYAILGGVGALLLKELWSTMQAYRARSRTV